MSTRACSGSGANDHQYPSRQPGGTSILRPDRLAPPCWQMRCYLCALAFQEAAASFPAQSDPRNLPRSRQVMSMPYR